ncbi:hypothetical protein AB0F15_37400 [Amycolatopsis sp. NPDC026612]|uniref:hypothetical protein n=1 Tax=Amycolatopsis sp. NPDC026612 TaxID=3155466 RepID=UPI0033F5608D
MIGYTGSVMALWRSPTRAAAALFAVAALAAGCGADPQAETVHAGREVRGQLELLRLVVTADRDRVPPVPSLSVTVRDAADELGAAGQDVGKLTDDRARAALASITDRAVAVAHRLDDGLGDGTDAGLDEIDAELRGLIGELARWGVPS